MDLIFFPRIVTSPHECILAGARGVAQQLSIDCCKNSYLYICGVCVYIGKDQPEKGLE